MHNPKIVFFDIDDTLYRKYTDTLRPSVYDAVHALQERGILTAIATGRPPVALPAKIKALIAQTGIDILVTINGQYIEFKGQTLQHYPMGAQEAAQICTLLDRRNIAYAFVNNREIAVSENTERVVEALTKILPQHTSDREYYRRNAVYQMLAFYTAEEEAGINAALAASGFKTARWHEQAVDILHVGGSKARGIAQAVAKLGIAMQDVMAFGDNYNDLEMLQTVGFGVAMGNGEEAVKKAAKYVCPGVDEDGVWRGLQALGVIG